jgi:beta-RFAP synthase
MITVQAASRLHFGLLSFPYGPNWPDHLGQMILPARRFGGVGLMVQSPGIALQIRPAKSWSAQGPLAERTLAFARHFVCLLGIADHKFSDTLRGLMSPPQEIIVERSAPEHAGLGTGTQLGLAVARGLSEAWRLPVEAVDLCLRAGRGGRSALGFHGSYHGGFLVEAGQTIHSRISPLVTRLLFPEAWRIVLVIPPWGVGRHGFEETEAFRQLLAEGIPLEQIECLCRLILLGLLPALVEVDFKSFGEALFAYNSLAGEAFAKFQGGTYASPRITELVQFIRSQGIAGAGQSSWGPTVFAVTEDQSQATDLARRVRETFSLPENQVVVTSACNHGATVNVTDE